MKRFVIVMAIALGLPARGTFAAGGKPEVAVLLPGTVEFFAVERKGMDAAAAKYGVSLTYSDAEWDAGKQLSQVEDFIARKVSAIMLCAADSQALMAAVKLCNEARIPLVTFTNVLGGDPQGKVPGVVTFVGISDVSYGHMMGQMAAKLLGDRPASIVLLEGNPGTGPQRQRSEGFKAELAKHPKYKIVYSQAIPGWTKEGALAAMEAFIQKRESFDLVSCQWSDAAVAAATAIKEANLTGKHVTALEFSKAIQPLIRSGDVSMTTNASISDMGFKAVETTARLLKGEKVPAFVEVKPYIVDTKNVDSVVPEL
jgi:ribose transport system substrate-binding protein